MHLIQTAEPYPEDYDTVAEQNHQEQEEGVVPELQSTELDIEQYDTEFSSCHNTIIAPLLSASHRQ